MKSSEIYIFSTNNEDTSSFSFALSLTNFCASSNILNIVVDVVVFIHSPKQHSGVFISLIIINLFACEVVL